MCIRDRTKDGGKVSVTVTHLKPGVHTAQLIISSGTLKHTVNPVSYTHLDVYKRQDESSDLVALLEVYLTLEGITYLLDSTEEHTTRACNWVAVLTLSLIHI